MLWMGEGLMPPALGEPSVNQMLPSGPVVMPVGGPRGSMAPGVGVEKWLVTFAGGVRGSIRPTHAMRLR